MSVQKHTRTCKTNQATYTAEIQIEQESDDTSTVYVGVSGGLSENIIEAEAKVNDRTGEIVNLFSTGQTREYDFNPAEEALENILPDYPLEEQTNADEKLSEKLVVELERLL